MKSLIGLAALLALSGCGGQPSQTAPTSGNTSVSTETSEALLTKEDILATLSRHGLNPETVPAPEVSKKMAEALAGIPNGTTDRFLLGIDKQGLMALGFGSIEDAKLMEERHKGDGFRHHNWYLGGIVPADVFNKTRDALRKG
ncbi:MAG: hypothetical protein KCHDKBKB_02520 [Elusimicrobia bacterium]|nr:hypothetical protein [Elusimicrobiota bacterium]